MKPANVKITHQRVRSTFWIGLTEALMSDGDSAPGCPAGSPTMFLTLTMRATHAGMATEGAREWTCHRQSRGR
jgi:hypothetical protein